jgi:hypothetical protein
MNLRDLPKIPGSNTSHIPHLPPDLDVMTVDGLQSFIGQYSVAYGMKKMFPTRPRNYRRVARRLISMACCRLKYLQTNRYKWAEAFESRYKTLPSYAQWRRAFNIHGCVLPGKKFRKTAPHKDRNGKWH